MVHRITLQVWTDVLTPLWREKRSITPTTLSSQDKDTSSTSSGRSGSGSSITSEICFEFSSKRGSEGIGLLTDDPCGSVVQVSWKEPLLSRWCSSNDLFWSSPQCCRCLHILSIFLGLFLCDYVMLCNF